MRNDWDEKPRRRKSGYIRGAIDMVLVVSLAAHALAYMGYVQYPSWQVQVSLVTNEPEPRTLDEAIERVTLTR
jgi:hypothetical protein